MVTINLGKKEIPLLYTVFEMKQVQEEIAPLSELEYILLGRNKDDEKDTSIYASADHLAVVAKLIRILGNAALEETEQEPYLTDRIVMRGLKPTEIADAIRKCIDAMNEGMDDETPAEENVKAKKK